MTTTIDPVCGMTIEESAAAASVTHNGVTYHFCSSTCQERFMAEPNTFATGDR